MQLCPGARRVFDAAPFQQDLPGELNDAPRVAVARVSDFPQNAHLRQYVVSRSLTKSPDPGVTLVSADPIAMVRELKQQDGAGIYLAGGGELAGQVLEEIDELVVKSYPIVAGDGVAMFSTNLRPTHLTLTFESPPRRRHGHPELRASLSGQRSDRRSPPIGAPRPRSSFPGTSMQRPLEPVPSSFSSTTRPGRRPPPRGPRRCLIDPALNPNPKRAAGLAGLVAYLALPFDLVPDFIPVAGQLDDAILVLVVLRTVP